MNNYRVKITAKTKSCVKSSDLLYYIGLSQDEREQGCIEREKLDYSGFVSGLSTIPAVADKLNRKYLRYIIYATEHEEIAMSVYAKAKRNLDLSKYSVTLELPGKGESC